MWHLCALVAAALAVPNAIPDGSVTGLHSDLFKRSPANLAGSTLMPSTVTTTSTAEKNSTEHAKVQPKQNSTATAKTYKPKGNSTAPRSKIRTTKGCDTGINMQVTCDYQKIASHAKVDLHDVITADRIRDGFSKGKKWKKAPQYCKALSAYPHAIVNAPPVTSTHVNPALTYDPAKLTEELVVKFVEVGISDGKPGSNVTQHSIIVRGFYSWLVPPDKAGNTTWHVGTANDGYPHDFSICEVVPEDSTILDDCECTAAPSSSATH